MNNFLKPYYSFQERFSFYSPLEVFFLIIGGVVTSLLELFTITALIPLMLLILDAENALKGRILGTLYRFTGLDSSNDFAILLATSLIIILLSKVVISILIWRYEFKTLNKWRLLIGRKIFSAIINSKHESIHNKDSSSLINALSSTVPYIVANYFHNVIVVIQLLLLSIFLIFFSFSINLLSTVIASSFSILLILVFINFKKKKVRKLGAEHQIFTQKMVSLLQMAIFGLKETKIALKEIFFLRKFEGVSSQSARLDLSLQFIQNLPSLIVEFISLFSILITFIIIILSYGNLKEAAIQISILIFLGMRFIPMINRFITATTMINSSLEPIKTVLNLYDSLIPETQVKSYATIAPLAFKHALSLKELSYAYDKNRTNMALKEVYMTIEKGQYIGIVGASGAGKSTIINIILGFLTNYKGSFLVDNAPVKSDNIIALRKIISFVDQHPFLMNDSYIANIAYGEEPKDINFDLIQNTLKKVGLLDHALSFEKGLETKIGENGKYLSGGQRQRLAIARALYKKAQILILDEASSALDMDSELEFIRILNELKGNMTIIAIAHRLSTLKSCDKLFFLEKGHIVAEGSFNELYQLNTTFRRYVDQSNIQLKI